MDRQQPGEGASKRSQSTMGRWRHVPILSVPENALPLLVCLCTLAAACGCIFGNDNAVGTPTPEVGKSNLATTTEITDTSGHPRPAPAIQPAWQRRMLTLITAAAGSPPATSYAEAWSLFSAAGWSDEGQIIVVASADHRQGRLLIAPPNSDSVVTDRGLTAAELSSFLDKIAGANNLSDAVTPAFDALTYEYMHALRRGAQAPEVHQRFLVRNPHNKPLPKHDAVITAFQAFRAEAAAAVSKSGKGQ